MQTARGNLLSNRFIDTFGVPLAFSGTELLADAELAEDEVKDVVGGRGTGENVEAVESFVEVEEDHLVGDCCGDGSLCSAECC